MFKQINMSNLMLLVSVGLLLPFKVFGAVLPGLFLYGAKVVGHAFTF